MKWKKKLFFFFTLTFLTAKLQSSSEEILIVSLLQLQLYFFNAIFKSISLVKVYEG